MESEVQTPIPTAMERITAAADTAGAPRAEKVMQILGRVLGAGEAAGMAVTIAGENARELQLRTGDRLNESAHWLENEITSEANRLGEQMTKLKDGAVATAKGWAERALKFGLTKATALEDKVVMVCNIPAGLKEKKAILETAKARAGAEQFSKQVVEQMTARASLTVEQRAILEDLLKWQEEERIGLEIEHAGAREETVAGIDEARKRAAELRADAANMSDKIEKRRVFKGWLAKMSA
ncbi:MAG: hypothetical protein AAB548_02870 [Patescibacteria group bacterium]